MEMDHTTALLLLSINLSSDVIPIVLRYLDESDNAVLRNVLLFHYNKHYQMDIDENWVSQYLEHDFFQLFRMTQDTFNKLLDKVNHPNINKMYEGGGIPIPRDPVCIMTYFDVIHTGSLPIPTYKQLLITLWWLGKGETLISIGERFHAHSSTVFKVTEYILERLLVLMPEYICWPIPDEMVTIKENFQEKVGFPGVIGAIDGTNIKFKAPEAQQDSYIDKNGNHSIKLQTIGTVNKIITNIFAGFPGSAHDQRVFRNSGIFLDITQNGNKRRYFPLDEYHLLGDKAYPLVDWLLTPYKSYGNLTARQRRYNTKHSKTRITIENIFGLLKGRWRILQYINVNSVEKAVKIIVACCILHNFCYINTDLWDEVFVDENEDNAVNDYEYVEAANNEAGQAKRTLISRVLDNF